MPTLAELLEGKISHADRETCARCQRRKASVYVQGRAFIRQSADHESKGRSKGRTRSGKTFASTKGANLCRQCAREAIGQIAQLLGTEVRDGEAD